MGKKKAGDNSRPNFVWSRSELEAKLKIESELLCLVREIERRHQGTKSTVVTIPDVESPEIFALNQLSETIIRQGIVPRCKQIVAGTETLPTLNPDADDLMAHDGHVVNSREWQLLRYIVPEIASAQRIEEGERNVESEQEATVDRRLQGKTFGESDRHRPPGVER